VQLATVVFTVVFMAGCSKSASVSGVVVDAGTGKGMIGVEIWATSDNLGKKVVAKTAAGGTYSLSVPAGEWMLTMNPRKSPTRLRTYFGSPVKVRLYEKDKSAVDTVWLLPYPPDSTPGYAYLVDKGRGYQRIARYGGPQSRPPSFAEAKRPFVMLFHDPTQTIRTEDVKLTRVSVAYMGNEYYLSEPPFGEEGPSIGVVRAESWIIAFLESAAPGGYIFRDAPVVITRE